MATQKEISRETVTISAINNYNSFLGISKGDIIESEKVVVEISNDNINHYGKKCGNNTWTNTSYVINGINCQSDDFVEI